MRLRTTEDPVLPYTEAQIDACKTPDEVYQLVLGRTSIPANPALMPTSIFLTPYVFQQAFAPFIGDREAIREFSDMTVFRTRNERRLAPLRLDRGDRNETIDSPETKAYWEAQARGHMSKALVAWHNHPSHDGDTAIPSLSDALFVNGNAHVAFTHLVVEDTGLVLLASTGAVKKRDQGLIKRSYQAFYDNKQGERWVDAFVKLYNYMGYEVYCAPWMVFNPEVGVQVHKMGISDMSYLNWTDSETKEREIYPHENINSLLGVLNDLLIRDHR